MTKTMKLDLMHLTVQEEVTEVWDSAVHDAPDGKYDGRYVPYGLKIIRHNMEVAKYCDIT